VKAKSLNKTQTDDSNMQTYMHGSSSLYDICSYCCRIPHIQSECHIYQNGLAVVFHIFSAWFVSVQGLSLELPTHEIS
jgi:hypothetical protein